MLITWYIALIIGWFADWSVISSDRLAYVHCTWMYLVKYACITCMYRLLWFCMVHFLNFIYGCMNRWGRGIKCGSMKRIYFPGSSANIVWKNFEWVQLQGWWSIWWGNVRIFCGALNAQRTYGTTSYMSCKGFESERRSYMMKGSIECKAQFNCNRCINDLKTYDVFPSFAAAWCQMFGY
jgi:hypothetical protein